MAENNNRLNKRRFSSLEVMAKAKKLFGIPNSILSIMNEEERN